MALADYLISNNLVDEQPQGPGLLASVWRSPIGA